MLEKISSDKINATKTALFFLSQAPARHSFTFNLRFLIELKHKVYLSQKLCMRLSVFGSKCFFIKFYIFVQQNAWAL